MKSVRDLVASVIARSSPVIALANGLEALAMSIEMLSDRLTAIVDNQTLHHQMIVQMWHVQQSLLDKAHEASVSMQMPDINKPKAPKKEQAN